LRDAIQARPGAGRLRVVSEAIPTKGKTEVYLCGDFSSPSAADGVVAARARVSRLARHERSDPRGRGERSDRWSDLPHGELVVIDPAPAIEAPRVGPGNRVEVVDFRPRQPERVD
jgi:hypothetical protein